MIRVMLRRFTKLNFLSLNYNFLHRPLGGRWSSAHAASLP